MSIFLSFKVYIYNHRSTVECQSNNRLSQLQHMVPPCKIDLSSCTTSHLINTVLASLLGTLTLKDCVTFFPSKKKKTLSGHIQLFKPPAESLAYVEQLCQSYLTSNFCWYCSLMNVIAYISFGRKNAVILYFCYMYVRLLSV